MIGRFRQYRSQASCHTVFEYEVKVHRPDGKQWPESYFAATWVSDETLAEAGLKLRRYVAEKLSRKLAELMYEDILDQLVSDDPLGEMITLIEAPRSR